MRLIGFASGILLVSALSMFGQPSRPVSVGGFGSVLYPGTGHPPARPLGGINSTFPGRVGGTIRGVPFANPRPVHPNHGYGQIIAYPVVVGGYGGYYGYDPSYGAGYPPDQTPIVNTNAAPSVVINQNFIPERANPVVREYNPQDQPSDSSGMRMYEAPPSHPYADQQEQAATPRQRASDEATIYLIALKDHNIVQALGYWMEGSTLHYVNAEHSLNQVSIDLIDRDLSQRLNDERGVEFKLPK